MAIIGDSSIHNSHTFYPFPTYFMAIKAPTIIFAETLLICHQNSILAFFLNFPQNGEGRILGNNKSKNLKIYCDIFLNDEIGTTMIEWSLENNQVP